MARTIQAKDIKPGMEVEWTQAGVTRKCVGSVVGFTRTGYSVELRTLEGGVMHIPWDTPVTVLSEPAPPQPEEPTEFGAKVTVGGRKFLRAPLHSSDSTPWLGQLDNIWRDWGDLINMGPVTVVPDQGWTVPDTPEVPDRIEEWDTWEDVPEGVAVENSTLWYHYRKIGGKNEALWPTNGAVWGKTDFPLGDYPGPWTRVTNA